MQLFENSLSGDFDAAYRLICELICDNIRYTPTFSS